MNIKYFSQGIKTLENLKKEYRTLARQLHPDTDNGDHKSFVEMKKEYDMLYKIVEKGDKKADSHNSINFDYTEIINKLIQFGFDDIEIIGNWIWVWGVKWNEKEKHAQLKSIGLTFQKGKKAWAKRGTVSRFWKQGMSTNQMRSHFGSDKVKGSTKQDGKKLGYKPLLED